MRVFSFLYLYASVQAPIPEQQDVDVTEAVGAPLFWPATVVDHGQTFADALEADVVDH